MVGMEAGRRAGQPAGRYACRQQTTAPSHRLVLICQHVVKVGRLGSLGWACSTSTIACRAGERQLLARLPLLKAGLRGGAPAAGRTAAGRWESRGHCSACRAVAAAASPAALRSARCDSGAASGRRRALLAKHTRQHRNLLLLLLHQQTQAAQLSLCCRHAGTASLLQCATAAALHQTFQQAEGCVDEEHAGLHHQHSVRRGVVQVGCHAAAQRVLLPLAERRLHLQSDASGLFDVSVTIIAARPAAVGIAAAASAVSVAAGEATPQERHLLPQQRVLCLELANQHIWVNLLVDRDPGRG